MSLWRNDTKLAQDFVNAFSKLLIMQFHTSENLELMVTILRATLCNAIILNIPDNFKLDGDTDGLTWEGVKIGIIRNDSVFQITNYFNLQAVGSNLKLGKSFGQALVDGTTAPDGKFRSIFPQDSDSFEYSDSEFEWVLRISYGLRFAPTQTGKLHSFLEDASLGVKLDYSHKDKIKYGLEQTFPDKIKAFVNQYKEVILPHGLFQSIEIEERIGVLTYPDKFYFNMRDIDKDNIGKGFGEIANDLPVTKGYTKGN